MNRRIISCFFALSLSFFKTSLLISYDDSAVYAFPDVIWKEVSQKHDSEIFERVISQDPDSVIHPSALTYDFSGGRFGDNLVAYFHAKWLAMKYRIPFLFKPFPLSDRLKLHTRDSTFSGYYLIDYEVILQEMDEIDPDLESFVFVVPYFPEFKPELSLPQMEGIFSFDVDWDDPLFHEEVMACIQPNVDVELILPPKDVFSIALHVRRGGAFESYQVGLTNEPLKFPPDSFYINEIARIAEMYKGEPFYAHIFTDDEHPEVIAEKYKKALGDFEITFNWEKNPSHSDPEQIFRDFYSMGNYDCLIHPGSNFSIMAGIIGDNTLDIMPLHFHRVDGEPIIDLVEIRIRN